MTDQRSPKGDVPAPARARRSRKPRFALGTSDSRPIRFDEGGLREDDVAQIVHDLRDPIATIALEAYLLDRKLSRGDHSDARTATTRIIRNVELLDRLVQELALRAGLEEGT